LHSAILGGSHLIRFALALALVSAVLSTKVAFCADPLPKPALFAVIEAIQTEMVEADFGGLPEDIDKARFLLIPHKKDPNFATVYLAAPGWKEYLAYGIQFAERGEKDGKWSAFIYVNLDTIELPAEAFPDSLLLTLSPEQRASLQRTRDANADARKRRFDIILAKGYPMNMALTVLSMQQLDRCSGLLVKKNRN
jgi:hypothetical protein